MLIALALLTALFALALRYTIKALLVPDIPRWRRVLPLALLLTAAAASLLRAVDIPEPAALIALPCNIAAIALAQRELREHRARTTTTD
ncbi:hypothetical protein [Streptomyces sp. Tu102]|uniref:hypothetical protein n=1 Tax=Streptomyces TaxID=1883 RepID=UPI001BDC7F0E|nr:hypothetical protein [Streptomyces sp. Tu102]MBT1093552.1 hypothetical protein [Streptomyces sp. Tu102]